MHKIQRHAQFQTSESTSQTSEWFLWFIVQKQSDVWLPTSDVGKVPRRKTDMKTRHLRLLSRRLIQDSTVHFQSSTVTFKKTHLLLFVATLHHHQKRLYEDYNRCNYTRKLFITINSIRNSREDNNLTYLHSYLLYSDLFLIYKQSTTCNQPFHIYRTPHSDIL